MNIFECEIDFGLVDPNACVLGAETDASAEPASANWLIGKVVDAMTDPAAMQATKDYAAAMYTRLNDSGQLSESDAQYYGRLAGLPGFLQGGER